MLQNNELEFFRNIDKIKSELLEYQKEYTPYCELRSNYKDIVSHLNINTLDNLINIAFLENTFSIRTKINDMIFFIDELKILDKEVVYSDYEKYTRLKYLYIYEFTKLKESLYIYDKSTKEEIVYILKESGISKYIKSYSEKELILFTSILKEYALYLQKAHEIKIFDKLSKSSKSKSFKAFIGGLYRVAEYYNTAKKTNENQMINSTIQTMKNLFDIDMSYFKDNNKKEELNIDTYLNKDLFETAIYKILDEYLDYNNEKQIFNSNVIRKTTLNKLVNDILKLKSVEIKYILN